MKNVAVPRVCMIQGREYHEQVAHLNFSFFGRDHHTQLRAALLLPAHYTLAPQIVLPLTCPDRHVITWPIQFQWFFIHLTHSITHLSLITYGTVVTAAFAVLSLITLITNDLHNSFVKES